MTEPSLLLLIPAYNEERRLEPVLRDYAAYFQAHYRGKFQLVVVLNGCRDNTRGVVERVAAEYPAIGLRDFADPIGKGGALIEGLKLAPLADLIGYVDADGATPPRAFHELVKRRGEADCVIGSRWLPGAVLHIEQSGKRRFASRVFHLMVEVLFQMHIRDTQCGAKVMRRQAIEHIHSALRIADMAFDINLLYSLKHAGYRILEVPTEWTDKVGSKVALFRTSLVMFLSTFRIRLIYSPCYNWLRPLRPLEGWIYRKLRAPQPLPGPPKSDQVPLSVTVPVTVTLTSPANGATYRAPATFALAADAQPATAVVQVAFFQGSTLLSSVAGPPYRFNLLGLGSGTYTFTAAATDALGATTTSTPVTIYVTPSPPPTGPSAAPATANRRSPTPEPRAPETSSLCTPPHQL